MTAQLTIEAFQGAAPSPFQQVSESTHPPIRLATLADQPTITAAMVLAFGNDPAARWMYPDPQQYLSNFSHFVQAFGGNAFAHETAYCLDDGRGAALWFPPGVAADEASIVAVLEQTTAPSEQADLLAVFEHMEHYHPKQPHWYLSLLGVEPAQQGKGYGSALMQPVLQRCDRDRLPAYLEASKAANIPFYERHGFTVMGTIQAGKSSPIFPMIRQPRP